MAFSENQLERYSRHFVLREIGVSGQKKLLSSKVLVIGAGALGSSALMYLASAGVGTIGITDYDCVELSNLQRQIIHRTENVGIPKTVSAEQTLKAINADIVICLSMLLLYHTPLYFTSFSVRYCSKGRIFQGAADHPY